MTLLISGVLSFLFMSYFYIQEGMPPLKTEILKALFEIFGFWFLIFINLAIPLAIFFNTKYLFNNCINAISLRIKSCQEEGKYLEDISYGDLRKVWRKWLFLIVWMSSVFVLLSFVLFYLFASEGSFFEWLRVYYIYGYILLSGAFALPLLGVRCKSVSLRKC